MDIQSEPSTNVTSIDLGYWKNIPISDFNPLMLSQKIDGTIQELLTQCNELSKFPDSDRLKFKAYEWTSTARDFTILLRDSLLAVTKYEQFQKDGRPVDERYLNEIRQTICDAAEETENSFNEGKPTQEQLNLWRYQKSPVSEITLQLSELEKQAKKIYRSISKIEDVRANINIYIRDFQLQYSFQSSAISNLIDIVNEVMEITKDVSVDFSETKISHIVDRIGEDIQKLELIQSTESIEVIPYPNREILSLPISIDQNKLVYKSINVRSEFAKWFSSFIYPKVIELESRRDHAVEKVLQVLKQVQARIAAISLADIDKGTDLNRELDNVFSRLHRDVLNALSKEEEKQNQYITDHLENHVVVSNVYSKEKLFLPENERSQISNLSRDAQKRIIHNFNKYTNEIKSSLSKVLSRYLEIDRTQYSQYVQNKLMIDDENDSLALFLKKGYLGKSFTVPRPEIIDPIFEDYKLWKEGFTGAILLSGPTGSGKSTLLGKLNHIGMNEELIHLKAGESYFIEHQSYPPNFEIKALIENVLKRTSGKKVILCIDDLEHWHNDDIELFDNISKLFTAIPKYRKRIFFVVTATPFLKERVQIFMDLNEIFSKQIRVENLNLNQTREALYLRAKVNQQLKWEEAEIDPKIRSIYRESKGNPGLAMLEYCRSFGIGYKQNMKSQEFKELISRHETLLKYISAYHMSSVKFLSDSLSELEFRTTIKSIDFLVGQKILVRPKKGHISIHPFLIHLIERILLKL
ncbi:MAG: ATP-binding protein [Saprospiraceae bacterium]|nr:ATP-binding protein [Saprospiraceae bacterium]